MTQLRFWRNTAVQNNNKTPGTTGLLQRNYLGYEWDESPSSGYYGSFRPAGLIHLSLTTVTNPPINTYLLDYGHTTGPGIATHSLSLYRDLTKGALVFGAGTVMWSWGLDADHDTDPNDTNQTPTDANVQQAMLNLLADMGVFPGTTPFPSGMVPPTKSSDTTPPTSTITSPANGANLTQNQTITITGTAADAVAQVAAVEVSTDNGATWHLATGTTSWSYNWAPAAAGPGAPRSSPARSMTASISRGFGPLVLPQGQASRSQ
jgi:Bacterial Ig domain